MALKTERHYWHFVRRYIKWLGAKSAKELENEPTESLRSYLSNMANKHSRNEGDEGVSASTQNGAFHAIRFLYEKVLGIKLGDLSGIPRATGHRRIVDVPEVETARRIVATVVGQNGVALRLILGTGARLNDALRLRVKDFDFRKRLIAIQESKGGKSRLVPMPVSLIGELSELISARKRLHDSDVAAGYGLVHMPGLLAKKYPGEESSLAWQYVFASASISKDPATGRMGRHHILDVTLQRSFAAARLKLRIKRRYTIHGLRHCAAQFWERSGLTRSQIQELLGHEHGNTTDRYLLSGKRSVASLPTPI